MRPRVVLCGSYHRDSAGLAQAFAYLERAGCRILSPLTLDFIDQSQQIVHTRTDQDISTFDLEAYHVRTIRDTDFVWLHAPEGVAGLSTAYEMGYATAWNKPIFTTSRLVDQMLDSQVLHVGSVEEALSLLKLFS